MDIKIGKPKVTDYGRAQFATEVAFNALLDEARKQGLNVAPVVGLVYLPTEGMSAAFEQACRDILLALTPPATHVAGADGKESWATE